MGSGGVDAASYAMALPTASPAIQQASNPTKMPTASRPTAIAELAAKKLFKPKLNVLRRAKLASYDIGFMLGKMSAVPLPEKPPFSVESPPPAESRPERKISAPEEGKPEGKLEKPRKKKTPATVSY